jgi:hypothetical protein
MDAPPAGISEADWLTWAAGARTFTLAQQVDSSPLWLSNRLTFGSGSAAAPAIPPNRPPVMGWGLIPTSVETAVAATGSNLSQVPTVLDHGVSWPRW